MLYTTFTADDAIRRSHAKRSRMISRSRCFVLMISYHNG